MADSAAAGLAAAGDTVIPEPAGGSPTVDEADGRGAEPAMESAPVPQPALWRWIKDNVDFRVGRRVF
jgi:hypothetical protein